VVALAEEDVLFGLVVKPCYFLSNVSAEKSVRDASVAAKTALSTYDVERTYRQDIYQLVKSYHLQHKPSEHTDEENRYLEKVSCPLGD